MIRVQRFADLQPVPWRNGGGETREVAAHPPGAGFADFAWRISMATVGQDGPFSDFPGVDRTLAILSGDGIYLSVQGAREIALAPASEPHAFPADVPTSARLIGGPVLDLNVMTRRGRARHRVSHWRPRDAPAASVEIAALVVADGSILIGERELLPSDIAFVSSASLSGVHAGPRGARGFLVEIWQD